jgi:hypothetical protein
MQDLTQFTFNLNLMPVRSVNITANLSLYLYVPEIHNIVPLFLPTYYTRSTVSWWRLYLTTEGDENISLSISTTPPFPTTPLAIQSMLVAIPKSPGKSGALYVPHSPSFSLPISCSRHELRFLLDDSLLARTVRKTCTVHFAIAADTQPCSALYSTHYQHVARRPHAPRVHFC